MKVKVKYEPKYLDKDLPEYKTSGSAGMDLRADLEDPVVLEHMGDTTLIPTGIYTEIPEGYEAQIRPRSGLALKHGITVLNTPGTIDSDYRNEWGVILVNLSNNPVFIEPGDRIAQVVFSKVEQAEWILDDLTESDRTGGFGSTGTK